MTRTLPLVMKGTDRAMDLMWARGNALIAAEGIDRALMILMSVAANLAAKHDYPDFASDLRKAADYYPELVGMRGLVHKTAGVA